MHEPVTTSAPSSAATMREPGVKTLCIPFLASRPQQYDPAWADQGFGTEIALFDRADLLDRDCWDTVRRTVRGIGRARRHPAVTFHFPVNDCDYIADPVVRDRLLETLDLVADCDLHGLVLHSNRVRTTQEWRALDLAAERSRFAEFVSDLQEKVAGERFWVGLENMPIMGNDGTDLDPLLVFPADFAGLCRDNVGITWDLCHHSYSVHTVQRLSQDLLPQRKDYPSVPASAGFLDFLDVSDQIVHYHFSAFRQVAASGVEECLEGMAPWDGTLAEEVYAQTFAAAITSDRARTITLEIRENDYEHRSIAFDVARWCRTFMSRAEAPS